MGRSVSAKYVAKAAAIAAVGLNISACDKTGGAPDTISMLKAGDSKTCSTDDVHKLLENIIAPQTPSNGEPDYNAAYLQARKNLTFSYNITTMDNVDPATHSMTCSTNLVATIGSATTGDQRISYKIQPTSDGDSTFAVTLPSDDAAAQLAVTSLLMNEAAKVEQGKAATTPNNQISATDNQVTVSNTTTSENNPDTSVNDGNQNTTDDDVPPPPPPAPPRGLY